MKFRTKVSVFDRPNDFDRPLALSFKNLAEDTPAEQVLIAGAQQRAQQRVRTDRRMKPFVDHVLSS